MIPLTIQDVLDSTGADLVCGDPRRRVRGVSTDTRTLQPEELFLALSGPNFDGNAFAGRALERGAAGVLLEAGPDEAPIALPAERPVLVHDAPRRALADLAAWHRAQLGIPVVAVAGSCGRTTTREILVGLLSRCGSVTGSPSSHNNDVGVPHTLLLADERTHHLVVEMGADAPGGIAGLCRTARPSAAVVTNLGSARLAGFVDAPNEPRGAVEEHAALLAGLPADGFCVLNADCPFTPELATHTSAPIVRFAIEGGSPERGDLVATDILFHAGGTSFVLGGVPITSPLLGLHDLHNLLAALAACRALAIPLDEVLPAVARLSGGRRRMERSERDGVTWLTDRRPTDPTSAVAAVRTLTGLHGHARRVLVLAAMRAMGERSFAAHATVARAAIRAGIDRLIVVDEARDGHSTAGAGAISAALEAGLDPEAVVVHVEPADVQGALDALVRSGDVILVTGAEDEEGHLQELCESRGGRAR